MCMLVYTQDISQTTIKDPETHPEAAQLIRPAGVPWHRQRVYQVPANQNGVPDDLTTGATDTRPEDGQESGDTTDTYGTSFHRHLVSRHLHKLPVPDLVRCRSPALNKFLPSTANPYIV